MKKAILLLVLCLSVAGANAATISYSDTAPAGLTYWSHVLTLPKFDPSLGSLQSVTFQLAAHVEGTAQFESLDAQPATVNMTLGAILSLLRPDNSVIVTAAPSVSTSDNVTAFDTVIDFAGTSGKIYPNLTADASNSVQFTSPPDDLSAYIGAGTFNVTATAAGNSYGSGAGNLILLFRTTPSAAAEVTYEYTPVPEPSSLIALWFGGLSLIGLATNRRR